jgi:hypothetical protein
MWRFWTLLLPGSSWSWRLGFKGILPMDCMPHKRTVTGMPVVLYLGILKGYQEGFLVLTAVVKNVAIF